MTDYMHLRQTCHVLRCCCNSASRQVLRDLAERELIDEVGRPLEVDPTTFDDLFDWTDERRIFHVGPDEWKGSILLISGALRRSGRNYFSLNRPPWEYPEA
jgi:hypothetical protein